MSKKEFCIVLTTTDNIETADRIARALVGAKVAFCVHIDSVKSFYNWEAGLVQSDEFRLEIKSLRKHYADIEKTIIGLHNYDIPQIIMLDIAGGFDAYLQWAVDSCPK